ncbi:MAG TPA: efflux RND transporter periplasmic adaptor subunit [Phycisphaerae bacterium]|nr:efflux RND transporter periplasmic adaptor subunit [Phycisphaerae bacterium]
MKRIITLIIILAVAGGLFAIGSLRRGADDKPILHVAEDVPLTVHIAWPERQEIIRLVQAPGDVEATLEVMIRSEIVAKIDEMPVEEGSVVKKGDLLCRLNDRDIQADVESGEARVSRLKSGTIDAEADLEKADRDYRRQLRLAEVNATSDQERLDYITGLKKAKAVLDMRKQELVEAEAFLRRVKEDLRRTRIISPIDGIVAKLDAKIGEVVITGTMNNPGTSIMTISDLSRMQVRARVDEVDVPLVKPEQKARIYLQADQQTPVPARVVRVASKSTKQVGRDVVNFETLLEVLSPDERIRPGMTANVEIEVAQQDGVITVPVEAIVHRMRKELPEEIVKQFDERQSGLDLSDRAKAAQYIKVVYVLDNEVSRVRLVEPGIADSRRVEAKTGVGIDDVVIVGPYRSLDQLKDGRKVSLSEDEKKKLATRPKLKEETPDLAENKKEDELVAKKAG